MSISLRMIDIVVVGEVQPLFHCEDGASKRRVPLPATGPLVERPFMLRDRGESLQYLRIG